MSNGMSKRISKECRAFCNRAKKYYDRELYAHDLFPPYSDFSKVCSCPDCIEKIKELKDFEENLKSKSKQVMECLSQATNTFCHCTHLLLGVDWSIRMFYVLHHKLRAVSEDLGAWEPLKFKLEDLRSTMFELRSRSDWFPKYYADDAIAVPSFTEDDKYEFDMEDQIHRGLCYYKHTNAKETAHRLLNGILEVERRHVKDEIHAVKGEKTKLEEQIKLAELLPVNELLSEAQEMVDIGSPLKENAEKLVEANEDILSVCRIMIEERNKFWEQYLSTKFSHKDRDHELSGLKATFQSLLMEAKSFEERWETYGVANPGPVFSRRRV